MVKTKYKESLRWVKQGKEQIWEVQGISYKEILNVKWIKGVLIRPGHKILSKFQVQGQIAIFIFKTRTKYFAA